jgi:hypothetical protein
MTLSGRLIVELLDYRSPNRSKSHVEQPERTRVLLHPNDETIWADILLLNAKNGNRWTDRELLELEATIVACHQFNMSLKGTDTIYSTRPPLRFVWTLILT